MEGKSLLANIKTDVSFRFYFHRDGHTYSYAQANENITIQEALLDSIQKLNV